MKFNKVHLKVQLPNLWQQHLPHKFDQYSNQLLTKYYWLQLNQPYQQYSIYTQTCIDTLLRDQLSPSILMTAPE